MYFSAGGNYLNPFYQQQYLSMPAPDPQNGQQSFFQEQEPTFCENLQAFHQFPEQNYNNSLKKAQGKETKGRDQSSQALYYQAHTACSVQQHSFTEYSCSETNFKNIGSTGQLQHKIGCREYFVNITFKHPISLVKLYQSQKKMLQFDNSLSFSALNNKNQCYDPNIILIPFRQFNISVKIQQILTIKENYKHQINFKVDLDKKKEGAHYVKSREGNITFMGEFQIIEDEKTKAETVNKMNFKFTKPHQDFILFHKFSIHFDQQDEMSPNSIQNLSKQQARSSNDFVFEDIEILSHNENHNENPFSETMSQPQFHTSNDAETEEQFITYIKTQAGSKQFQKKVKGLKNQEIEIIINQILGHLEEIILNEYANYMFQSLIAACNFEQRMRIILKVGDILAKLVCQQQGTFVFQQLISFLTREEQFQSICKSISKDFKQIALDNFGNHFMRKLIQNMPKQMLSYFLQNLYENFCELARNKNAVCVMKCVLRALKEGQNLNNQFLGNNLKRYLSILTLHTQNLINDQFGNYLIQQAFELISSERLGGISEYIIKHFTDYSCQKFSSNVVLNCIKKYWKNQNDSFLTLKKRLQNKQISFMYHNLLGNKILLEVMELPAEFGLKDKINSVIRNQSPTKYNNRRWVSITGKSKTGAVGTHFNNFSEAHSFSKKRHYS